MNQSLLNRTSPTVQATHVQTTSQSAQCAVVSEEGGQKVWFFVKFKRMRIMEYRKTGITRLKIKRSHFIRAFHSTCYWALPVTMAPFGRHSRYVNLRNGSCADYSSRRQFFELSSITRPWLASPNCKALHQ